MRKPWTLIDVILRDGYPILQRPDEKKQARRDAFVANLRSFLQSHGMQDMLDDRAGQLAGQAHTETAYHEILRTLSEKLLTHLSAAELVWAVLWVPEKSFRRFWDRMFKMPTDPEHMFDPVTVKLPVDQDGGLRIRTTS